MSLLKLFESNYKSTNTLCNETKGLRINLIDESQSIDFRSTDCDSFGDPIDCYIDCGSDGETIN